MCERGITMVKIIAFAIMTSVCTVCTVLLERHDSDLTGLAAGLTIMSFIFLMLVILFEI